MTQRQAIDFIDNNTARSPQYICVTIHIAKTLESWRSSVFSFQWLNSDGSIKNLDDLPEDEHPKRKTVEEALSKGQSITKPILGIGIRDNVEIGSGQAVFLTLAAHGVETMPVHIPKSNERDFQAFLADVDS